MKGSVANLVRRALLGTVDDSKLLQIVQALHGADRVSDAVEHFQPYGFRSVPPVEAEAIVVCPEGSTSNMVALVATDRDNPPPTDSAPLSVGLYIPNAFKLYVNPDTGEVVLAGDGDSGREASDAVAVNSAVQDNLNRLKAELDAVKADLQTIQMAHDTHIHITTATVALGPPGVIAPTAAPIGSITAAPEAPTPTGSTTVKVPPEVE